MLEHGHPPSLVSPQPSPPARGPQGMPLPHPRVLLPHCSGWGGVGGCGPPLSPGSPSASLPAPGSPRASRGQRPLTHPLCYRVPKELPLIKPEAVFLLPPLFTAGSWGWRVTKRGLAWGCAASHHPITASSSPASCAAPYSPPAPRLLPTWHCPVPPPAPYPFCLFPMPLLRFPGHLQNPQ